jgi:hypothetical protein
MVEKKFRVSLYTLHKAWEAETLSMFWDHLNTPLVSPKRYDSVERAKIPFAPEAVEEATKLYAENGFLFVKGEKDGFLAVLSGRKGFSNWDLWLNIRAMEGGKRQHWLDWIYGLCRTLPPRYGYGCSSMEYDAKHQRVRSLPGGGAATEWVGISKDEFHRYLPGLYWLTIFGPELVQAFGKERLLGLRGVVAMEIDPNQVAVQLDEPVIPEDITARLQREREIADLLGPQYFFDGDRPELEFQVVPQLAAALTREP